VDHPGHHPLSGPSAGSTRSSPSSPPSTRSAKAKTFFLQAGDDYVVDLHRGYSTGGDGKVDTTWAFVWHLDAAGKVDRVVNLSGDQHQMDAFIWANFPLMPLPERLVG
jgi:uncharacterized protein